MTEETINANQPKHADKRHNKTRRPSKVAEDNLKSKKHDPETQQTQYPATVGYHGSDDEKDLNPEE